MAVAAVLLAASGIGAQLPALPPAALNAPVTIAPPPRVDAPREWSFPRDHGQHPGYGNEWWYVAGILADEHGARFGCQFTIFRHTISPAARLRGSGWATGDIYVAHAAVSDLGGRMFRCATLARRPHLEMAGAANDNMDVWVRDWRLGETSGTWTIAAAGTEFALNLGLRPAAAPWVHGPRGFVNKGTEPDQASYYYSLPRIETSGTVTIAGRSFAVTGQSWFDHDFGNFAGERAIAGSDWFGLRLADGTDVMVYRFRLKNGGETTGSLAAVRHPDGRTDTAGSGGFSITPLSHWTSKRSGARYPARCRLEVPGHGIDLAVEPLLDDQELRVDVPARINYWEGAVKATGWCSGKEVEGEGYGEFTGYDRDEQADDKGSGTHGR